MKNEKSFFSRFVYNGGFTNRDCLRKPFERDGFIYATDTRIMVRVSEDLCEEKYEISEKPKNIPPFPNADCCYKLELKELVGVIKSIPECETIAVSGKEAECDECEGDGRVEWTYEDSDGEEHYDYFDCPICGGKGKVATKEYEREERAIGINGLPFNVRLLENIADAMNDIGLTYVVIACLAEGTRPMLIQFQKGIDVIIMPTCFKPCREIVLKSAQLKES